MIQDDYILRMLERFFQSLHNLLKQSKTVEDSQKLPDLTTLYTSYLEQNRSYFFTNDAPTIWADFEKEAQGFACVKSEIAAELLYLEAKKEQHPTTRRELLNKALSLLEYSEVSSSTFSVRRTQQIRAIKNLLDLPKGDC